MACRAIAPPPGKRSIHYGEWFNEEYGHLVENLYREQAARAIQRLIRKARTASGKKTSAPDPKFKPMTADLPHGRVNLTPMTEPTDDKYKEHAEKIKEGRYLALDYADPEFTRNLFKALRLNEITLNQMLMAQSIYQAKAWLHDYDYPKPQLREHRFSANADDDQGPYKPESIKYKGVIEKAVVFRRSLEENERQYFTINFSKTQERLFLLAAFEGALLTGSNFISAFMKTWLLKCADRLPFSSSDKKNQLNEKIERFFNTARLNETDRSKLQETQILILDIINAISVFIPTAISQKDKQSMQFLQAILQVGNQNPAIIISPEHREDDPNSPLIAFLLIPTNTEKKLQLAMHGNETTVASPTAGLVTTRMIRALDERPAVTPQTIIDPLHAIKRKLTEAEIAKINTASSAEILKALYGTQYAHHERQARPVEIIHPDLTATHAPHNYDAHDFLLTWHDMFHCWRNGRLFKDYIRHLRTLLTKKGVCQSKDLVMSKPIWGLSDMDFSSLAEEKNTIIVLDMLNTLQKIIINPNEIFSNNLFSNDLFLLFFIDMIKNPETWDQLSNITSIGYDTEIHFRDLIVETPFNKIGNEIKTAFLDKQLVALIERHKDKSNESVILRCKLRKIEGSEKLCDLIDTIGIDKFFYWDPHGELYFKKEFEDVMKTLHFSDKKRFKLDLLYDKLFTALLLCLEKKLPQEQFLKFLQEIITHDIIVTMENTGNIAFGKVLTMLLPHIQEAKIFARAASYLLRNVNCLDVTKKWIALQIENFSAKANSINDFVQLLDEYYPSEDYPKDKILENLFSKNLTLTKKDLRNLLSLILSENQTQRILVSVPNLKSLITDLNTLKDFLSIYRLNALHRKILLEKVDLKVLITTADQLYDLLSLKNLKDQQAVILNILGINEKYFPRIDSQIACIPGSPLLNLSPYSNTTNTQSESPGFFANPQAAAASHSDAKTISLIKQCIVYLNAHHTDKTHEMKCDAIRALLNAVVRLNEKDPSMTPQKLAEFIQQVKENKALKNKISSPFSQVKLLFKLAEEITRHVTANSHPHPK